MPAIRIATTWLDTGACGRCGREWEQGVTPVPTAYTVASIEAGDPPVPVCDHCIEAGDAALFEALLADRRRFYAS